MLERPGWLIQTKLCPPLLRDDTIPRSHLLTVLHDRVLSHRLTLLSAPAGYGKTTLLTSLASLYPDLDLAWLSLDEGDNDPVLFLAYLVAALQCLNPTCGLTAQALLSDLPNPGAQARQIAGTLVNDVLETRLASLVLILDDLHVITEPVIYVALDYLLERLPPQMHLVVGTRHDPPLSLARLRARGQLAELRVPDLRFNLDEAAAFLNECLGLGLSSADLAVLQRRTEGWPVGLSLLAGSLGRISNTSERTEFIDHLARTDRYVFDFLAEEVLNRQDESVQAFLLETSILSELTPAMCKAVTGRSDAASVLEDLDRRGLFVVALDKPRTTFRYHALFAEFLRRQLEQEMPERVADLHRRAAEAQPLTERAIVHYLAGKMWEEAAQAIEQVGERMAVYQGLTDTLTNWIHDLPASVYDAHPRLSYLLGLCFAVKGEFEIAVPLLEQALQGFEAAGDEVGQGETLAYLVDCAFGQADFARGVEMTLRALEFPLPVRSHVQVLMERVSLGILLGDLVQADADFEAALGMAQEAGDPEVLYVLVSELSCLFAVLPHGLERLERINCLVTACLGDRVRLTRIVLDGVMASVHLWRGRLGRAIEVGEGTLSTVERWWGSHPPMLKDLAATVAVAHAARGDYAAADRFFDLLFHRTEWLAAEEAFRVGFLYLLGRTRWLEGRLEDARRVCDEMASAASSFEFTFASVFCSMMQGLIEMGDSFAAPERGQNWAEAERLLRQAVDMQRDVPLSILFGNARLLLARLYLGRARSQDALAELSLVLAECERRDAPGWIIQEGAIVVPLLHLAVEQNVHAPFATRLLETLGTSYEPRSIVVPATGETLTRREVEVLRLIAAGASNRAIAEQLVISGHTVKSHVTHILRKLDVSSRVQAATRARDLGIAPWIAGDDVA
jgi:LuxR family maltose regulon positive regulatory protein